MHGRANTHLCLRAALLSALCCTSLCFLQVVRVVSYHPDMAKAHSTSSDVPRITAMAAVLLSGPHILHPPPSTVTLALFKPLLITHSFPLYLFAWLPLPACCAHPLLCL